MQIKDWVRAARQHAKLTQEALGEKLSLTKGNISGWENGRHEPSFQQLLKIHELTGYPLLSSDQGGLHRQDGRRSDAVEVMGEITQKVRCIPVVGTAKMGDDGYYEEFSSIPGAGDGCVEAYSRDMNAYALRLRGDSMFPAIRDGWYAVVEPESRPTVGEYVAVKLKNGKKMVKELLYERPDAVALISVNGGDRITVLAEDLENIQAIGAIVPPSKWKPDL